MVLDDNFWVAVRGESVLNVLGLLVLGGYSQADGFYPAV